MHAGGDDDGDGDGDREGGKTQIEFADEEGERYKHNINKHTSYNNNTTTPGSAVL